MILGTWMYSIALKIEQAKARLDERNLTRALALPLVGTTSWLDGFEASGKMPVVVGVAVIIGVGLSLWWILNLWALKRLEQEEAEQP